MMEMMRSEGVNGGGSLIFLRLEPLIAEETRRTSRMSPSQRPCVRAKTLTSVGQPAMLIICCQAEETEPNTMVDVLYCTSTTEMPTIFPNEEANG